MQVTYIRVILKLFLLLLNVLFQNGKKNLNVEAIVNENQQNEATSLLYVQHNQNEAMHSVGYVSCVTG